MPPESPSIEVESTLSDQGRSDDVFALPTQWRADIIADFRLRGEERCAAASPGPGFPQLLGTTLDALVSAPPGPWLDLGGGLGGVGSWLHRRTHRPVVLADLSASSLRAARGLFPELSVARIRARQLAIRSASVGAVIVSGMVSLLNDIAPLVLEVERVLVDGGLLTVADLWSADEDTIVSGPNTFWSIEDVLDVCTARRFSLHSVGVCETSTGWWSSAAEQVDDEVRRRHSGHSAFPRYEADRQHLVDEMASGRLIAAAVTLSKPL